MARKHNAKATPYYELTERMGKGLPFRAYTDATRALKREMAHVRRNPDEFGAPRRRRGPSKGLLLGAAAVGAYLLYERHKSAPAAAPVVTLQWSRSR